MKCARLLLKLGVILVLATVAMLAVLALPVIASVRYGDQKLSIHPDHGPAGTEVCLSGSSFTPSGMTANLTLETTFAKIYFPDENTIVKTAQIDIQGNFETCFIVGEYPAGLHKIWVYDESASPSRWDSKWTYIEFRIEPKIELGKSSGYVGDSLTIAGTGLAANSGVAIYFDGSVVATATTEQNGSFTQTIITIPESKNGNHSIKAVDTCNNQSTCEFITKQQVTISPTSGTIGEPVTINGTGFTANKDITIAFDDNAVVASPTSVKTSQTGNFAVKLLVPTCIANTYTIEASDGSNKANATFVAIPSGKMNRIFGYIGSDVTFSGNAFIPDRIAVIYYDNIQVAEATVDADGSFSANFTVPASSAGEHAVAATDGTNAAKYTFTVVLVPSVKMNRIFGHVGNNVTLSGTRFIPDRIAVIYYDNIQVAEATVDADGSFSVNFTVPASSGGEHAVSATDGTNTAKCTFTMESRAPPIPVPLLPANTSKVKPEACFVWEGVTDPSGVTYALQIASDACFTSDNSTFLVLDRRGLTTTKYISTPEERLELNNKEAPYYWRVRAIDNASNAGGWSTVQEFYVDIPSIKERSAQESYVGISSPPMPPWVLCSLIAEGGIFVCIFGYWLIRRRTRS